MSQPWKAEIEVALELAGHLIAEQFPSLAPVHIEPFGMGWDNVAFLINKRYVFRFPQRAVGAALVDTEIKVMPHLATRLPLRVPNHQFVGEATEAFGWRFSGYELIEGRTACRANLTNERRIKLAAPLATFLRTLHSILLTKPRVGDVRRIRSDASMPRGGSRWRGKGFRTSVSTGYSATRTNCCPSSNRSRLILLRVLTCSCMATPTHVI